MHKTNRFYDSELQRYFDEYYSAFEDSAAFYNNPAPNQWKFYIPEYKADILLICHDSGRIEEFRHIRD